MNIVRRCFPLLALAAAVVPRAALAQFAGSEFQVNTYTTNNQYMPAVAADSTGDFVVVWTGIGGQDGNGGGIFAQRYSSTGAAIGGEFQVNTYTTGYQYLPAVASDPAGDFVVVWSGTGQGDSQGVFGQRFDNSGVPAGTEFGVNTYTTDRQYLPAVAADPSGGFIVVWQSSNQPGSGANGVYAQRYDSNGATLGSEFLVNTQTGNESHPSVATDSSGGFVVVWQGFGQEPPHFPGNFGIFAQRYDSSGAAVGGEFQVNTYVTGDQEVPKVATDTADGFVVVWRTPLEDGSATGIFGQRYDSSGATLGGEFQVNSYTTGDQYHAAVTGDSAGGFVVVWDGYGPGDDYGVFGQRFNSSGTPVGSEFRANTYTLNGQYIGGVAPGQNGDFVVVWKSGGQDGSGYGIFGQRFCAIATCTNGDGCCPEGCNAGNDNDCPVTTTTTSTSTSTTSTTLPPVTLISGKTLKIKDNADPTKRKILFLSLDPAINTTQPGGINPVADGAFLHVYNSGTGDSACFTLASGFWVATGSPPSPSYVYRDTSFVSSACNSSSIKDGAKLKVGCLAKTKPIAYTLNEVSQGSVAVVFGSGSTRYCTVFGGVVKDSGADQQFLAKNAPAPASCPVAPASCP